MSAGHVSSGPDGSTASWLEPESNQTSRMFISRSKAVAAALRAGQARRARTPSVGRSYQASAPYSSKTDAALFDDRRGEHRFAAAGAVERRDRHTPGALARDAPVRAVRDHVVDAVVAPGRNPLDPLVDRVKGGLAQRRAARLRPALTTGSPSIRMNHCEVARKITGLWQRQQCG